MTTLGSAGSIRTPSGMKVAPMSYAKIEAVAVEVRPLLPLNASNPSNFEIDAQKVLEKILPQARYQYVITANDELKDCAAFTIPEHGIVVLREDVYDGLFTGSRFSNSTVIHELAHIVLNHSVTLHRDAVLGQHKFYEDSEWQAKALTAAIMMPIEACRQASCAGELAQLCGTSEEAATYRLDRLIKSGELSKKTALTKGLF
ncbi:hypothetical protein GCM10010096_03530 [Alcaligenes pakistanensis]|uniref:IrrE N-terminal-like domain-containing protein n=1 Tax=Alcaligenes pakistanensis TaxID=1482717 RepID=A0A8H9IEW9_9BURK|nr:ImmA/IrrE family metallo-endopeptidase [Alcaligenes pakistanensis]GHC37351.1 hypothetical protein GCM10010096_03530 [Alcaligenes pakistanensis]